MADRSSHTDAERKASGGQALVQIGHYVLGETLGIGTFGKVKGKSFVKCIFSKFYQYFNLPHFIFSPQTETVCKI